MSTTTAIAPVAVARRPQRAAPEPIPTGRLLAVELRKMFDTRAGFWLMSSIGILAVIATTATIIFAPRDELTYETFATAIGMPMAIVLPIVAILSVTSEWSQRSALTTFTLVPHRSRVIAAKATATLLIAVASMLVAAAVGAVGNIVGTTIAGVDATWNISLTEFAYIVLANILGMFVGFMLGVVFRNSPAAVVGYFVYSLVLPGISSTLGAYQQWWQDNAGWFDHNSASTQLFNGSLTGEQWVQLGLTTTIWLIIPLVIGMRFLLRSEIK